MKDLSVKELQFQDMVMVMDGWDTDGSLVIVVVCVLRVSWFVPSLR